MPNTTTTHTVIGNGVLLSATSEWVNNKRMDTDIRMGSESLCWISGAEYEEFIAKLQNLINEYRI